MGKSQDLELTIEENTALEKRCRNGPRHALSSLFALAQAGEATLWIAVFADMGASLLVVFNGLRLLRFKTGSGDSTLLRASLAKIRASFKRELRTYRLLIRDPRTPRIAKITLALAISYALLPFEARNAFLPGR